MSSFNLFPKVISSFFVISSPLLAQTANLSDDSLPTAAISEETVKEALSPRDSEAIEAIARAAAETQKNMLSVQRSPQYLRVLEFQKRRADYIKSVAAGKVRPFPQIVENWSNYTTQVSALTTQYAAFNKTTDPIEKSRLAGPIITALQPVGKVLRNADHGTYEEITHTEKQYEEHDRLMQAYNTLPTAEEEGKLELITPSVCYMLKNLPMPIEFTAPKDTEIILFSELGGLFENGLDYIRITANEEGVATTSWSSRGDGVASCNIIYRSPEYEGKGRITPIVKQLSLLPLETLSPVTNTVKTKVKQTFSK